MKKLLPVAMLVFISLSPAPALAESPENLTTGIVAQPVEFKEKLALGENYRNQGSFVLAAKEFEDVYAQAEKNGDRLTQAMAASALGYNHYLLGEYLKAQELLKLAESLASPFKVSALTALIDDYLGMVYLATQQPEKATVSFDLALNFAELAKNDALIAGIHVNQAVLESNVSNRIKLLENTAVEVLGLNDELIKTTLLLNMGEQLLAINSENLDSTQKQQLLKNAYQVLNNAYLLANAKSQIRLRSQAEGYLARLYVQQGINSDALVWLDKAIFDAQQVNATDLLMQWEMQNGKLLRAGGNLDAASEAYKRSVKHLASIHYGLPVNLHNGNSSIKEIIDPVYRGLADILLLQAGRASSNELKQGLLKEAIGAMEAIKQTELEDFFNDHCLIDEAKSLNLIDILLPGIAIIYPIILPDRVELLFRAGDSAQIEQSAVAIASTEVTKAALEMAQFLREGKGNYRIASHKLYSWLLESYDEKLKAKAIGTVVFVPDGPLRQVPFSALLNGKHFAVEDYSIITLPGLVLKKNDLDNDRKPKALIAALSKPDGASIDELLKNSVKDVFGEQGRNPQISQSTPATTPITPTPAESTSANLIRSNLIEKLSLPSINEEVSELQKTIVNTTLMNKTFTYGEFQKSVVSGDFSIIHIASHGYFGKSAEDSFVMTYDHNLKLGDFQTFLNNDKIKKTPIDLLTLSACQTAAGDDRALLGFSGMAIKANALSAIGTLWSISDVATATFMENFYASLAKLPKAQALRQAQLFLLKNDALKHPYYWAPFILVGNW